MTVIASVNLLMSAEHRRWLTMKEMLHLQGFPTSCEWTFGAPCSSFALRQALEQRGQSSQPWPSRRAVCHQTGNSMHVAVSGLTFMFLLTQIEFDNNLLVVQEFNRKRSLVPNVLQILTGPAPKKARL